MNNNKELAKCRPPCRKVARPARGHISPTLEILLIFVFVALTIGPNGPLPAKALYPYRILKNNSHLMTLTPEEWTSEYECNTNTNAGDIGTLGQGQEARSSRLTGDKSGSNVPNVCYREPTSWRYHFIDELLQPFKVLVQESSIDERLSDTIYTTTAMTGLNFNHYRFRSGEGRNVDLHNERLVAGSQVNDQLCRDQLKQMLDQIVDLRSRLDEARKNSTAPEAVVGDSGGPMQLMATFASPARPEKFEVNLDERHFRLARVLDSFGRYEPGLLGGRHHAVGMYGQCIETQLALPGAWSTSNANGSARAGEQLANSRFCWASLSLDRYLSEPLAKRKRHEEEQDNFGLHLGVCVPEACHSKSFNPDQPNNRELARDTRQLLQQIINSQFRMPETIYLQQSLELDRVFCLVDSNSKWAQMPLSGRILLAGLAGWACLLVFATYKRRHKHSLNDGGGGGGGGDEDADIGGGATEDGTGNKGGGAGAAERNYGPSSVLTSAKARHSGRSFLENLDLFESWCEFIGARDKQRAGPINLDTLNPLKCIASLLVILVHAGLIVGPLSAAPLQTMAFLETSRFENLLLTGFVLIDTFFVISALLLTYISLKKLLRQKIKRHAWRRQQQLELRLKGLMLGGTEHESETTTESNEECKETATAKTSNNGRAQTVVVVVESSQSQSLAIDLRESEAVAAAVQAPLPLPLSSGPNMKSSRSARVHLFGFDFFRTWAFITLYRYFRLVPLYFLVFWFKKSVFNYLGSGPFWDHGLNGDTPAGGCRQETWFTPISFMAAYQRVNKQCLPQTWSVSNDLFFNLTAPPLIILYFKRPKLAKWLGSIMVVVGLIAGFYAYYIVDPRYRYELERLRVIGAIIMFALASHMYTNPIYRVAAICIGIMGGYALYRYEQKGTHELLAGRLADARYSRRRRRHSPLQHEWPGWFKRVATPAAFATIGVASLGSFMVLEIKQLVGEERGALLVPLVLVAYHAVWSLSNVVVLLRMVTDWKDSFLMRMSSAKFWSVGSKLTYCLLLIHWDLLTYDQNTRLYAATFSRTLYLAAFSMAYLLALFISTVLHVCIENPLDKLTKTYLLRA